MWNMVSLSVEEDKLQVSKVKNTEHCFDSGWNILTNFVRFQVLTATNTEMAVFWEELTASIIRVNILKRRQLHGATFQETAIFEELCDLYRPPVSQRARRVARMGNQTHTGRVHQTKSKRETRGQH
jgi:hypothetical protein